jgi:hypothetical protein
MLLSLHDCRASRQAANLPTRMMGSHSLVSANLKSRVVKSESTKSTHTCGLPTLDTGHAAAVWRLVWRIVCGLVATAMAACNADPSPCVAAATRAMYVWGLERICISDFKQLQNILIEQTTNLSNLEGGGCVRHRRRRVHATRSLFFSQAPCQDKRVGSFVIGSQMLAFAV